MKIALYGRPSENNLSVYINQLISAFTSLDAEVYIYEPFYKYLHEKLGFNASLPFINTYEDINNNILYTNSIETIKKAYFIANKYKFSFYDSLIVAAALECNCKILYSEDLQHKQVIEKSLTIINPFNN